MNLPGIEKAAGLPSEARAELLALLDVDARVSGRNALLDEFFESDVTPKNLGVRSIPDDVLVDARCDWSRKAVTSVSERVRLDGFSFAGGYADEAFERVVRDNGLVAAFNRAVASELTHGCMFATVGRWDGRTRVRMHTAESAVAVWDDSEGRIGAGLVTASTACAPWSPDAPVPVQANLHLPGAVVALRRTGPSEWSAEAMATPVERPMMEAFCFRPTGTKPFGQTRITPTVRSLHLEVQRTIQNMVVCQAFYAFPQKYLLGLTDEMYDALSERKWDTAAGAVLLATTGEDGAPSAGQFPSSSPQPFIDAIAAYGKLFSGATGVPLNSLGIVQDNPSSAEAIAAQREDICTAAEDCIESNRAAMRDVALMAMAVEGDVGLDGLTDEQRSVAADFKNPMRPSLAATADAMTKVAGVLEGFSQTREFLSNMGFTPTEVESVRNQLRRSRAQGAAVASAQAALVQARAARERKVADGDNAGEAR